MDADNTFGCGYEAGEKHGKSVERVRLRPLLERCLAELEYFQRETSQFRPDLLGDIRRELGKGGG